jgi:hypothetical protein
MFVLHPRAELAHLTCKLKSRRIDETVYVGGWGNWWEIYLYALGTVVEK